MCAAPKAGKNILQKNLHVMSEKQIFVIEKQSLRGRKGNDGQDKMTPIIEKRENESQEAFESRKSRIKDFTDRANKAEDEHNAKVNELLASIKDLECSSDPNKNYIIAGKQGALQREQEEYARLEQMLLTEAVSFFDSKFQAWNWRFHKTYYGIDLHTIEQYSKEEREKANKPVIPVIMVSNVYQLRKARELLGDRLIPIFLTFVATDKSNYEYHKDLLEKGKYANESKMKETLDEIEEVRQAYFDNIGEFRHVLLNSGVEEDLHDQIINIVRLYGRKGK